MAFEELKQKQSVMWGNGPYERVTDTLADAHDMVVGRIAAQPGERWLDLATGTGAVARKAAQAGAQVTGIDLAPVLIETAKREAAEAGLDIDFRVGDCENLEGIDTASFDIVTSTCGVMFAPNHEATASELARVIRPGGRLAMVNWTPEGGVGELFQLMKPFQPPPPEGVRSPFEWGKHERAEELLGEAYDLNIEEHVSTLTIPSGEDYGSCSSRATARPSHWRSRSTTTGASSSTGLGRLLREHVPGRRRDRASTAVPARPRHPEIAK